jgi:hypothetical protein
MTTWLDTLPLGSLSESGVILLFVIGFLRGWIFTRAHYNDLKEQRDKWEEAYWKEKEAAGLQDKQADELLETARTMKHFIDAFPRAIAPEVEERGT